MLNWQTELNSTSIGYWLDYKFTFSGSDSKNGSLWFRILETLLSYLGETSAVLTLEFYFPRHFINTTTGKIYCNKLWLSLLNSFPLHVRHAIIISVKKQLIIIIRYTLDTTKAPGTAAFKSVFHKWSNEDNGDKVHLSKANWIYGD